MSEALKVPNLKVNFQKDAERAVALESVLLFATRVCSMCLAELLTVHLH